MLRNQVYCCPGMASAGTKTPIRGVQGRRGAGAVGEALAPLPSIAEVQSIDSLNEICDWLGTFRERLRLARSDERTSVIAIVQQLEARYQHRRAELS